MSDLGSALGQKAAEMRRRAWRRLSYPFVVRVYTFEHTRVEVRSFPPRFRHAHIESLAERLARGGRVNIERGSHIVYESLVLPPGAAIVGPAPEGR